MPGTAVFLSSEKGSTPFALLHNLKHNKVLHEQNLFVTVVLHEVPWIGFDRRCQVESLGHDCWQVTLHFGFKNDPDVPEALALLRGRGVQLDEMDTSYFLSRDIVIPTLGEGMAMWREKLFASMHRNAAAAADFLSLPTNRVVELGGLQVSAARARAARIAAGRVVADDHRVAVEHRDRKSTRLNSSHGGISRMPSSA